MKRGAHSGLSNLKDSALNKINTGIDNSAEPLRKKFRVDDSDDSDDDAKFFSVHGQRQLDGPEATRHGPEATLMVRRQLEMV